MTIDLTIEADTLFICSTTFSHVRLMNDSRWPWLIVLPRDSNCTELHQLDLKQRNAYLDSINQLSGMIQEHTRCQSVNIAMLGNVVSALHCHVVARNANDPNWPKPIWGFEKAVAYSNDLPDTLIQRVRTELDDVVSVKQA